MQNLSGAMVRDDDGNVFDFQPGPNNDASSLPYYFAESYLGVDITNIVRSNYNEEFYVTASNGMFQRMHLYNVESDNNYILGPIWPSETQGININKVVLDNVSNVYLADDLGTVYKYDQNLGDLTESPLSYLWKTLDGGTANDLCLSSDFANLFVAKSNGVVYKLSTADGSLVWQADIGESVSSIDIDSTGVVYAGTVNGKLVQIKTDGTIGWSTTQTGGITQVVSAPNSNNLYVGGTNSTVLNINITDGSSKWTYQIDSKVNTIACNPSNGRLYVGTQDGNLYRLDVDTGEKRWWGTLRGRQITRISVDYTNVLYVILADGSVYYVGKVNTSK